MGVGWLGKEERWRIGFADQGKTVHCIQIFKHPADTSFVSLCYRSWLLLLFEEAQGASTRDEIHPALLTPSSSSSNKRPTPSTLSGNQSMPVVAEETFHLLFILSRGY